MVLLCFSLSYPHGFLGFGIRLTSLLAHPELPNDFWFWIKIMPSWQDDLDPQNQDVSESIDYGLNNRFVKFKVNCSYSIIWILIDPQFGFYKFSFTIHLDRKGFDSQYQKDRTSIINMLPWRFAEEQHASLAIRRGTIEKKIKGSQGSNPWPPGCKSRTHPTRLVGYVLFLYI